MAHRHLRQLMCAAAGCPPHRGRHTQTCLDDPATKCDGCLPRPATDGAYVCERCLRLMAEDPLTLIGRYADLERILAGGGGGTGEHVTTIGRDPNMQLNQRAAAARYEIRHEIVGLVQLITEERGFQPPIRRTWRIPERPDGFIGPMPRLPGPTFYDTRIPTLCKFVARYATWLASHDAAAEHAGLLRRLVRETYATAYPDGVRVFPVKVPGGDVADCPATDRGRIAFAVDPRGVAVEVLGPIPCPGWLWTVIRPKDAEFPAELLCNDNDAHRWPARSWLALGAQLAKLKPDAAPLVAPQLVPASPDPFAVNTFRRRTARGFDLVCNRTGCAGIVHRADWGTPADVLLASFLASWERHICTEQAVPAASAASERTAA